MLHKLRILLLLLLLLPLSIRLPHATLLITRQQHFRSLHLPPILLFISLFSRSLLSHLHLLGVMRWIHNIDVCALLLPIVSLSH